MLDPPEQISAKAAQTTPAIKKERDHLTDVMKALDESTICAITDKVGTIIYANKKFEEISKYPILELLGKNHRILKSGYHPPEFFDDLWKTISSGRVWTGDVKNLAKDGSVYWVKTVITPFLDVDGKPEQYMAIRMDITKQKALEEQVAASMQELQDLAREKEEYAAMITHDLKQPLVPIKGHADMLNDPKMGELNQDQKESVDEIILNSMHLGNMIENLLTSFKIGAHALEFKIENLSSMEILDHMTKEQAPVMVEKNIEYVNSTKDNFTVAADKKRIYEIFINLVQNSADFVPDQGGRIEIGSKDDGEFIQFHVKDNGIGMPKDKQEKLFTKYYQVKTRQPRRYGGTGLGLAICKELVEGMKGKIWLESEEGKGTIFFFTIPKGASSE